MFGAIYGDIIGSYYELHCTKNYDFHFEKSSCFTDDSVLIAAVCEAILDDPSDIGKFAIHKRAYCYAAKYKQFYSFFPNAGFGNMFSEWAKSHSMYTERSYGNGASMRVIPIGYAYDTIEQTMLQAKASCLYTHRHREAIKGAQAVAAAVFLSRHGENKKAIKNFIEKKFRYDLSQKLSTIREHHVFDSRTSYSVPPAIIAFLEADDYESAVRGAVSLGGDSDTQACIAGGIAEAFYGEIPDHIRRFCDFRIDNTIKKVVRDFNKKYMSYK